MDEQLERMLELMNENEELKEELKIKNSWIKQAFIGYLIIFVITILCFVWLFI